MMSSISQPLEVIRESNNIGTDAVSNSAPQLGEGQNPLSEFQSQATETTVTTETPCNTDIEEATSFAPGENKNPISLLTDEYCKEMAKPHLFPYGIYSYKVERYITLTPNKYFNERLLNFLQVFAADSDYIFLHIQ